MSNHLSLLGLWLRSSFRRSRENIEQKFLEENISWSLYISLSTRTQLVWARVSEFIYNLRFTTNNFVTWLHLTTERVQLQVVRAFVLAVNKQCAHCSAQCTHWCSCSMTQYSSKTVIATGEGYVLIQGRTWLHTEHSALHTAHNRIKLHKIIPGPYPNFFGGIGKTTFVFVGLKISAGAILAKGVTSRWGKGSMIFYTKKSLI